MKSQHASGVAGREFEWNTGRGLSGFVFGIFHMLRHLLAFCLTLFVTVYLCPCFFVSEALGIHSPANLASVFNILQSFFEESGSNSMLGRLGVGPVKVSLRQRSRHGTSLCFYMEYGAA